jgi:hypothetical protein
MPVITVSSHPVQRRPLHLLLAPVLGLAAAGCLLSAPARLPTLSMVEHGLRINLPVLADGWVEITSGPARTGRLDLAPILAAEAGTPPATIQCLVHYGRFYFLADGFRNVWEVTPRPGTTTATYRPVPVDSDHPLAGARLSGYGPEGRACVRVDQVGAEPKFIHPGGSARGHCG